ncbi:MAG: ATP-dependent DNA helicase RecG [Coriobacteriaceae bacterium]|nr:ATP-dependent DNA helicase RecG [Coriobacteriaceae bacterium]
MQEHLPTAKTNFNRLAGTLVLDEPVSKVRLVSPARAKVLESLGIESVRDLVTHYPRRYIDMSQVETVTRASIGEMCTIIGNIHEIHLKTPKPRLSLVEISLVDRSGTLLITCFRQPWLMDTLKQGMRIAVSGKLEFNYGFKRMTNPFIEVLDESFNEESGLIVPVHSACAKISTALMRRLISNALELCQGTYDPLPLDLRCRYRLLSRQHALANIHFPTESSETESARRRLVYEELLFLELYLMTQGSLRSREKQARAHQIDGNYVEKLTSNLPFTLTDEQTIARDELLAVMNKSAAANHLLLGDVGTGKTIVAAFGIAACADTGTQALMMAPTEILARQYALKLGEIFETIGIGSEVLTSSTPAVERETILAKAAAGTIDVLFGTHALLEDDVVMKDCSFVVIDEQHRFGVNQRAKLLAKGDAVDALYLSATPIPRSLALALYGDLSLSYLKTRPRNLAGNTTKVYPRTLRGNAYDAALKALSLGKQVYVVCPLVGKTAVEEESTKKAQSREASPSFEEEAYTWAAISIEAESDLEGEDLKAARKEAEFLQNTVFRHYQVDLLHGKMSGAEKQEAMTRFSQGETHVLVATTIIEVGVDVVNASVMIIEDADRFGLAQLHQLRGRVGRGDEPGEVFLISSSKAPAALERLAAMEATEDGFELASFDLSLRREGDILGNRQHGASVLKLVNVVRDAKIIEAAHADAQEILDIDPTLESETYRPLGREMRLAFKDSQKTFGG